METFPKVNKRVDPNKAMDVGKNLQKNKKFNTLRNFKVELSFPKVCDICGKTFQLTKCSVANSNFSYNSYYKWES